MKFYIFYIVNLCFILPFNGYGQNLVQYKHCQTCNATNHDDVGVVFTYDVTNTTYESVDVASDYGPRDFGSDHYDWHGGVDYSSEGGDADRGDGVVAIVGGTIHNLRIGNAGYKYILVNGTTHDFGYGHIFTSASGFQKSGNFYIKLIVGGNANLLEHALIIEDGTQAFYDGGIETVIHPITGDTITTTSTITAGETVGPIGTSIGSSNTGHVSAHLHLYLFENNNFSLSDLDTKNPLGVVDHQRPSYNVSIEEMNEVTHYHSHGNPPVFHNWRRFDPNTLGIDLIYPGTEETNILVKATVDNAQNGNTYSNAVLNIEKFEVLIRSLDFINSESLIQGPNYDSEIVYDGIINQNTRYPTNLHTDAFGEANEDETGIECWAYSDRRQRPWDYYNFADFVSRIHENDNSNLVNVPTIIADVPENARYNDGDYIVKGRVTDIRGTQYNSPDITFTLDNFMPFITNFHLYSDVGTLFEYNRAQYENGATLNNGVLSNETATFDNSNTVFTVYPTVFVSEPMKEMSAKIFTSTVKKIAIF